MKETPDTELLNQMSLDNVDAFEEIYNRYSMGMFRYAINVINEKQVCEDIIQNIFIDFWSKRGKSKIQNLKPFLFQSVKYQIFNHLRNRKFADKDLAKLNIADMSMDVCSKLEYHELESLINRVVEKLPTRCRQIFKLSRFQHKSHKEIAQELGISIQAVKNQISKALIFLRQYLHAEEVIFHVIFLFTI